MLYPFLHGAVPSFPLTYFISDIDCRWYLPLLVGDTLSAAAVAKEVIEVPDRAGRNTLHIIGETTYRNQNHAIVGIIEGTVAAIELHESEMMLDREISAYSASVRQLWLPLCTGAKLVLVNEETWRKAKNPGYFAPATSDAEEPRVFWNSSGAPTTR